MKRTLFFVATAVLTALCGCINYEEELTINKDGSGTVVMHYWTGASFASVAEQKEKESRGEELHAGLPFSEDQAKRELDIPDTLKVLSFSSSTVSGYRHITVRCEFEEGVLEDPDKAEEEKDKKRRKKNLGTCLPFFANSKITFEPSEHKPSHWIFKLTLDTKDILSVEEDKTDPGDTVAKSVLSAYKLKFVVHFPGRVLKTNGKPYAEGETPPRFQWFWGQRKAVWEFPLVDVTKVPDMTATIAMGYTQYYLLGAFILVIIILIVIVIKARPPAERTAEKPAEKAEKEPEKEGKKTEEPEEGAEDELDLPEDDAEPF